MWVGRPCCESGCVGGGGSGDGLSDTRQLQAAPMLYAVRVFRNKLWWTPAPGTADAVGTGCADGVRHARV